ncbi:ammonium transporter [Polychaeton citri CBS 116435]|uniref:Ammonium transporter n=1 Tax=Polychaeton citri CBS 116435 TaxID=1314669 RepID=A0A9P4URM1_9PEZI|nr:ammonium transporter [Polychaeton citri CBS 116435]
MLASTESASDNSLANLPYVPYQAFNTTDPTGGDSLSQDLNVFYQSGDIAWLLTSTALVLLMIPGIGLFYSGLARRKSALSLIVICLLSVAVTSFQWFFWGFSLTFSHTGTSGFIGDLQNVGLRNVLAGPSVASRRIPDLLFAVYQCMFAAITVAIATGAAAERGRIAPLLIFIFIWSTVVYDPIAYWSWNPHGWTYKLGGLDFAGGTPVHISSGAAALAYSYALGKRTGHGTPALNNRPHNISHIVLGTVFLWVGWFGFNAGSALSANMRAVMAAVVTNLAAATAGLTWCILDYRLDRKWSMVGFCSGVVAGLVTITPGSGFVPAWAAVIFGLSAGIICNFATQLKYWIGCDDAFDIFAVHCIGGILGNICTGFFAADYIAHLDGYTVIPGGWVNHNWVQLGIQLADSIAGLCYSFVMSCLILLAISFIGRWVPFFELRMSKEEEEAGADDVEIGEYAYDYVEMVRDVQRHNENNILTSQGLASNGDRASDVDGSDLQMSKAQEGYPMRSFSMESRPRYRDDGTVGYAQ